MRRREIGEYRCCLCNIEELEVIALLGLVLRHELGCCLALGLEQLFAHDDLHAVKTLHGVGMHFARHNLFDDREVLALQFEGCANRIETCGLLHEVLTDILGVPRQIVLDRGIEDNQREKSHGKQEKCRSNDNGTDAIEADVHLLGEGLLVEDTDAVLIL